MSYINAKKRFLHGYCNLKRSIEKGASARFGRNTTSRVAVTTKVKKFPGVTLEKFSGLPGNVSV